MEELVPLLEQLAKELNTTVEFLWQVLIKQANIFAIIYICRIVLLGVFGLVLTKMISIFTYWADDGDSWQSAASIVAIGICGIAVLFFIFISVEEFGQFVTALLNPEYWALQQILEQTR